MIKIMVIVMIQSVFQDKIILVVGGDLRQMTLAKLFREKNKVFCLGLEQFNHSDETKSSIEQLILQGVRPDYIILPMPVSIDNQTVNTPFSSKQMLLDDVLSLAHDKTIVYGGKISPSVKQRIEDKKLWYFDYLEREEFAILNAIPTAEGAIQIAMEEIATTIYDTKCLIVGYGRISKVLAKYLHVMGADVTVSARKYEDLAWIKVNGFKAVHTNDIIKVIGEQQIVFNTVPATVLNENVLLTAPNECLMIDLASKPGGIDFEVANKLGIKTIWALSLPGKVAPITAGKIIFNTIQNIENERRLGYEED